MEIRTDSESYSLHQAFENIVEGIFLKNKFIIQRTIMEVPDFIAMSEDYTAFVEVKLYRSKLPKLDLLKTACLKLLSQRDKPKTKLILVVSSYISPSLKHDIFKETSVTVWGSAELFALAFDFAETYYELESLLTQIFKSPLNELSIVDQELKSSIIPDLKRTTTPPKPKRKVSNIGEELCNNLNRLNAGKQDATKFENQCILILKYLFDNDTDLKLWSKQPTTDDGLHRFDLLCRIISYSNSFWSEIAHDFHTRYVVFEFKNYSEKIKQGQIYTTEKYLFLTALRSVSFIIARNGADSNAIKASKGALKEAGKLIVILTMKDICDMLKLKDNGDEPSSILRLKIDDMLVKLTR